MTNEDIIAKAIECVIGRELKPETIIAHRDYERAMTLIRYEGDQAICNDTVMGEVSLPRDEIFDVNLMQSVAHDILAQHLTKDHGDHGTMVVDLEKRPHDLDSPGYSHAAGYED